jgi:hypothetical protein
MSNVLRTIRRGGKPNTPKFTKTLTYNGVENVPNSGMRLLRRGGRAKNIWPQIIKQATADKWNRQDTLQFFKQLGIEAGRRGTPLSYEAMKDEAAKRVKTKGQIARHHIFISG